MGPPNCRPTRQICQVGFAIFDCQVGRDIFGCQVGFDMKYFVRELQVNAKGQGTNAYVF